RQFQGSNHDQIQPQIVQELTRLFPASTSAKLLRARVVTERAATFSPVPGVDRWRPNQTSPIGNLFLAGDWTATGWPGTMEGAVRSGYLAAEALMSSRHHHLAAGLAPRGASSAAK
ncbi:MAG TPA: FAD-dependent oxidoreductase, partial [Gemmataceae bacterium]|nr:FAD-dependent oxidoreductase [Gemmataceae bacterium]